MSKFKKNFTTLLAGTILSQAAPLLVSPVLTRIYSPEEFGVFGFCISLATLMSVLSTGRYEQALILTNSIRARDSLVFLSSAANFIFLLVSLFVVLIISPENIIYWCIPLITFILGYYRILHVRANKEMLYKNMATGKIIQNWGSALAQLFTLFGLVIGDMFGKFVSMLYLHKSTGCKIQYRGFNSLKAVAIRFKAFLYFDTTATFLNFSAYQSQVIFIPFVYDNATAGLYFLVIRVLQSPLSLVSASLTDVYKQKLGSTKDRILHKKYYLKMLKVLLASGIVGFSIFSFFVEDIFSVVFGSEWSDAGKIALYLMPMYLMKYIASPLSYFLYVYGKQKENVFGNLFLAVGTVLAMFFTGTIEMFMIAISILFSLVYCFYIWYSGRLVGLYELRDL